MRLKDKAVLITGGANGIGRATAMLFAQNGATLMIADYDEDEGLETVKALRSLGACAEFVKVNVANMHEVEQMVDATVARFSRIDVLVNNAGITRDGFLVKMSPPQWDQVLAVNLTGVFYSTQAAARVMLNQGQGVILNAASVVGIYGNIGQTNYAATKSGVIGMTKTWAKELGPKGIRVNAVAPGFIKTGMTEKVPDKVLANMVEKTPLRRLGKPEDVANAYLFLASDEASFINGVVLGVDGGLTF
ncbi:3-oxoacyl-ACP reductase FabG [Brevibacillus choshinensis]|uniref:3-oxoacyl-ACP reductase FabG n=1 Tax=Brevibacillus choshinensis TaxID=54911 RepID=UPI002E20A396|nr:3-oxoacyl-ACP reductase FabG [Brevibacillus choshinensis]MED4781891.1 3-oxoacyl-ACP reductase FabG [Brevibacillus choshinensis]